MSIRLASISMIFGLATATALALAAGPAGAMSCAACKLNGTSFNGLTQNGLTGNGLDSNGPRFQGIATNDGVPAPAAGAPVRVNELNVSSLVLNDGRRLDVGAK